MKRLTALFVAFTTVATCALLPLDEAGFQKLVASHKGKVVLYDFWATWCEPCRAELPKLVSLEAKLRPLGFELITISADEPETAAQGEKVIKQLAIQAPVYRKQANNDEKFIDSIDMKWSGALPALFLYDKQGHKVRSFIGETDTATVEAAIRKLL
jgi:thiol-disulfide isomerase/thioredoxin